MAKADIDAVGVTNMLEAIRVGNLMQNFIKFMRCLFIQEIPQKETTLYPSPYGVAKLYGHW